MLVPSSADNLGNHIATTDITMNDNDLLDANTVQANTLLDPEDGTLTVSDNLNVTGDITVQGADIRDNSGDLRLSGEDNVYISMDYNNNDANTRSISLGRNDEGGDANYNELMRIDEGGNVNVNSLAGAGTRMVVANATGDLSSQTIPANGDITGVTAGAGITGGGTTGTVTVSANANNGLNVDLVADAVQLGGALIENTTITQGAFSMIYNLNSTGDFSIQDNGTTVAQVRDDGLFFVGDDMYWRDGSVGGTNLMSLTDDSDDGRLRIYENGATSIDLDANTQFIFNEQGLDRDFRVESDGNANMLRVDAAQNRVGIGIGTPSAELHVFEGHNGVAEVFATGVTQGSGMFFAGQSATYGGGFVYDGDGTPALVGGADRVTFFRRNNGTDTDVMSYAYNCSTVRITSLAGSGNRMVIANANGDLSTQSIPANGDITGVNAGDGLTGGGTAGTVTLNVVATNGLTDNANDVRLGGVLIQNTTITQGNFGMNYNMNGTGDFQIQDAGVPHFTVLDNGLTYFGDDTYWRDGATNSGDILGR